MRRFGSPLLLLIGKPYCLGVALEPNTKYLRTGCASLDRILGGLPRGEATLIYGEPATGKTTLALQTASSAAKNGWTTLFIDADNSFRPERLTYIAGDSETSRLILVSKPNSFIGLTQLLTNLGSYVSSEVVLVVVDTVTSLYRKAMMGDQNIFLLNRELNLQLAYLVETARTLGPAILITSQVRSIPQGRNLETRIEPVATRVVKFWSQRILRISTILDRGLREICIEKSETTDLMGKRVKLKLGKEGFTE
jgi:DNA repair protein RadB